MHPVRANSMPTRMAPASEDRSFVQDPATFTDLMKGWWTETKVSQLH